jgi:hypothetical protein
MILHGLHHSNDTDAPDDTINTNPRMRINFTSNDDIENQIQVNKKMTMKVQFVWNHS